MDILKQQLQQQLVSNALKDKFKNNEKLIFNESRCVFHRRIPFTTPFLRDVMMPVKSKGGKWEDGDYLMYEIRLDTQNAFAQACIDINSIPEEYGEKKSKIFAAFSPVAVDDTCVIKKWQFNNYPDDLNGFFDEVDKFLTTDLSAFEKSFYDKLSDIHEGEKDTLTSTRYERNPLARKMCLDYHGTACKVCGMDFGKTFGPEFAGKIEVHHIVPISEIGENYVIDPIKDLIPLCPNCHTAIHSKKGGTYTVEELKAAIKK